MYNAAACCIWEWVQQAPKGRMLVQGLLLHSAAAYELQGSHCSCKSPGLLCERVISKEVVYINRH